MLNNQCKNKKWRSYKKKSKLNSFYKFKHLLFKLQFIEKKVSFSRTDYLYKINQREQKKLYYNKQQAKK